jgi:hypothetical protein
VEADVVNWLKQFNGLAHTIAGLVITIVTLYSTIPQLRDAIDGVLKGHPVISSIFGGVVAIVLTYKGSHTAQGAATLAAKQGVTAQIEQPRTVASEPKIVVSTQPPPVPPVSTVDVGGK